MKVIFLDIDWVLIRLHRKEYFNYRSFDTEPVSYLKEILKNPEVCIVVSSSWRYDMDSVKTAFEKSGLPWDRVIDRTPSATNGGWSTEILMWLDEYHRTVKAGHHITHWVAIDDEQFDMKVIRRLGKLVKTDASKWLTFPDAMEAILILTK